MNKKVFHPSHGISTLVSTSGAMSTIKDANGDNYDVPTSELRDVLNS